MTSLADSFLRFSKELNQIAEREGKKAAADWDYIFQNGALTKLINDTFFEIGRHSHVLNQDRGRFTTIQPSLYEIFLGKLIKHFFEEKMEDEGIEVILDSNIPLNSRKAYPDVLIQRNKEPMSVIELKHILKKNPYQKTERKRRDDFLAHYSSLKTYSIILYAIYDKSTLASIVEDGADWIYIIRFDQRAKKYRDKENIPFLHRRNPVELALNEVIEIQSNKIKH